MKRRRILQGLRAPRLQDHHGVVITDAALVAAVDLSMRLTAIDAACPTRPSTCSIWPGPVCSPLPPVLLRPG